MIEGSVCNGLVYKYNWIGRNISFELLVRSYDDMKSDYIVFLKEPYIAYELWREIYDLTIFSGSACVVKYYNRYAYSRIFGTCVYGYVQMASSALLR